MSEPQQQWTETIEAKHSLFDLKLGEVWRYKDLVYMFVKRDFVSSFKQTVLEFNLVFHQPDFYNDCLHFCIWKPCKIAYRWRSKILFYLVGVTLWNYFSSCLTGTSYTFAGNAGIFGKVYFPRLVTPISVVISNLMKFGVQFALFLVFFFYYWYKGEVQPNWWVLATPFLIILMAAFALGAGMIFSALTTKYRDLNMLLGFGVSLYMYATPVIYPVSALSGIWKKLAMYNPLTGIFECFKYGWLGKGEFSIQMLLISTVIIFTILALGTLIFNKVEKTFMDTV
ncbi:ABC transporter permease [Kaistella anthropi]|nr:ABC transporter permease [Kaistella anthropi]